MINRKSEMLTAVTVFLACMSCAAAAAVASSSSGGASHYVVVDLSKPRVCVTPAADNICKLTHDILSFPGQDEVVKRMYKVVEVSMKSVAYFPVMFNKTLPERKACEKSILEYSCANLFGKCTQKPGAPHPHVSFDKQKTGDICKIVKRVCPAEIVKKIAQGCTNIVGDSSDFTTCSNLTPVPNAFCSTTAAQYPKFMTKVYPQQDDLARKTIADLRWNLNRADNTCEAKLTKFVCEIRYGPSCQGHCRVQRLNSQDCSAVMKHCLKFNIPIFEQMCELLPDKNTASTVPAGGQANNSGK